jgi:hypothetical protein
MSRIERFSPVEGSPTDMEVDHVSLLYSNLPRISSLTEEDRSLLERSLVVSLDLRLMPLLILFFILNFLDRVSNFLSHLPVCFHCMDSEFYSKT